MSREAVAGIARARFCGGGEADDTAIAVGGRTRGRCEDEDRHAFVGIERRVVRARRIKRVGTRIEKAVAIVEIDLRDSGVVIVAARIGDRRQGEGLDAVAVVGDRKGQHLTRRAGRRRDVGGVARIDGDVEQLVDEQVDAVRIDRRRAAAGIEARGRGVADGGAGACAGGVGLHRQRERGEQGNDRTRGKKPMLRAPHRRYHHHFDSETGWSLEPSVADKG